jgi:hypothetical protein
MTAAGNAGQAISTATVVRADLFACVIHHEIREADRVGQREREHEDAGKGHALAIALFRSVGWGR